MSENLLPATVETVAPVRVDVSPRQLISQAIAENASVETLERLAALDERLRATEARAAFTRAMAEFQASCPVIGKAKPIFDKHKNYRYSFAPLDDIIKAVRGLLREHGFSYTFDARVEEKNIVAVCTATHAAGHSQTSEFKVALDPDAYMSLPQKHGAALTFAKRYAFCNAFGIITGGEDNDALPAAPRPDADTAQPRVAPRGKRGTDAAPAAVTVADLKALYAEWQKHTDNKQTREQFMAWAAQINGKPADADMSQTAAWTREGFDRCREVIL